MSQVLRAAASAARVRCGTQLIARPVSLLRFVGGRPPRPGAVLYARVLGVRHLLEAVALLANRAPKATTLGSTVDAIHAATAIAQTGIGDHRRLAAFDAAAAIAFAAFGALVARQQPDR